MYCRFMRTGDSEIPNIAKLYRLFIITENIALMTRLFVLTGSDKLVQVGL